MLDLYFAATPNAWKVTIMLEEAGLPYNLMPVKLAEGEQSTESFRAISPNGRIPAIVDHDAPGGP